MKQAIDIEDLLVWAYRVELPKVPVAPVAPARFSKGWASMGNFADLLAVVDGADVRNVYGVTPDRTALTGPHEDALRVAAAVDALDGLLVDAPADWWPFGDMATRDAWGEVGRKVVADVLERMCEAGEHGARCFKHSPAWMVRKHAMVATRPDWEAEAPEYRLVRGANGKAKWFVKRLVPQVVNGEIVAYAEHEGDGYCASRKRPFPDAYHKMELVPSPFYAACDRAEYEVWHAGLVVLADALRDSLAAHRVTGPRRAARPWEASTAQSRILPSIHRAAAKGA